MRDDQAERTAEDEGFDSHVSEATEGFNAAACVEGGDDEVTAEGGLKDDLGDGAVANLSDEDDFGILPQEGLESGGEIEALFGADLRLGDTGEDNFDGIFEGDDVSGTTGVFDDFSERGVGSGGFAAARGTCEKNDTARGLKGAAK